MYSIESKFYISPQEAHAPALDGQHSPEIYQVRGIELDYHETLEPSDVGRCYYYVQGAMQFCTPSVKRYRVTMGTDDAINTAERMRTRYPHIQHATASSSKTITVEIDSNRGWKYVIDWLKTALEPNDIIKYYHTATLRPRKTIDIYEIRQQYSPSTGYEYLDGFYSMYEARYYASTYRVDSPYPTKIVRHRESRWEI